MKKIFFITIILLFQICNNSKDPFIHHTVKGGDNNSNTIRQYFITTENRRKLQVFNVIFSLSLLTFAGISFYLRWKLKTKVKVLEKTQQQLKKQNDFYQLVTENTTQGLWDYNIESETGTLSRQWYPMFGYESVKNDVPLSEWIKYVHPDDLVISQNAFDSFIQNGGRGQYEAEMRLRRADGTWNWTLSRGRTVSWDSSNKPLRIIGLHLDIQKAKESQIKIKQSEENFIKLFRYSPIPMVILSEKWNVINVNKRFTDVLGYSLGDVESLDIWLHPTHSDPVCRDDVRGTWQEFVNATTIIGTSIQPCEYRVTGKDGTDHITIIEGTVINKNILISFYDITDHRKAEEERENIREQLLQSQKLEAVGVLAGGVAHDFNNMIAGIMGFSELVLDELEANSPHRHNIEKILDASHRSADLTRQLLAFARKQTIAPVTLHLNKAVDSMLALLKRLIGENIDLTWLPGKELDTIKIDPTQLDQILANLCVNARDAIVNVGQITIETDAILFDQSYCDRHADFKPGKFILLAVSDNGIGMDNDTISHIFEPFFTTKALGQGTGMGLATIYGIVKQNGGFINVYSEPKQGTTFKVYFPSQFETAAENNEITDVVPAGNGETILLVEDDITILEMTETMLKKLGYNVLTSKTPSEAIRTAGNYNGDIHLVITDVIMPEMNGRQLADLLPGCRSLFMSGYTANVIAHQGVLDEGVHFISKPFSRKELAVKVRNMLD